MSTTAHSYPDSIRLREFESFLHTNIPLTQAMQLQVDDFCGHQLNMSAPLLPNINDKGTAFGGSGATLKIISGWSLLKLNLLQHDMHHDIVISKSTCRWRKPLTDQLLARASLESSTAFEEFLLKFKEKGKTMTIEVNTEIYNAQGETCSSMKAKYAIIQPLK